MVSQFGEVAGINLVRDKDTGKSKGYAFLKYVDQRSTILAVDNLNGAQVSNSLSLVSRRILWIVIILAHVLIFLDFFSGGRSREGRFE